MFKKCKTYISVLWRTLQRFPCDHTEPARSTRDLAGSGCNSCLFCYCQQSYICLCQYYYYQYDLKCGNKTVRLVKRSHYKYNNHKCLLDYYISFYLFLLYGV